MDLSYKLTPRYKPTPRKAVTAGLPGPRFERLRSPSGPVRLMAAAR